jgi:hypothetical protein
MSNLEAEKVLGVWSDDPRSVAGAMALGLLNSNLQESDNNQWASEELLRESDDPRVVSTMATVRDARMPERLFMPGNNMVTMKANVEYTIA